MAGRITVSTLNDDTGVLATQNGMSGIAKAWVNFNGQSLAIRSAFNVSSVTRFGTGQYVVSFTTAFANTNYGVAGMAGDISGGGVFDNCILTTQNQTTSSISILARNVQSGGTVADANFVSFAVFSS